MIQTALAIHASGTRLEDRAAVLAAGEWTVIVVADGAGGISGGAAAAEIVIQQVRAALPALPHPGDPGP